MRRTTRQFLDWKISLNAEAGAVKIELDNYGNLAIGDILEIDPGIAVAEVITVVMFGSVYMSGPLRFPHRAGAGVRRLIEVTGAR